MKYLCRSLLLLLATGATIAVSDGCGAPISHVDDGGGIPETGPEVEPDATAADFGLDVRPLNASCRAPAPPSNAAAVRAERVFSNYLFQSPMLITQAPGDASRFFVVEQSGRVKVFPNKVDPAASEFTDYLDIATSSAVDYGGEKGLLGLAFHPKWGSGKPTLYLSYTRQSGEADKPYSRIGKWESADGGLTMVAATEQVVFDKVRQPFANHNGGWIGFGRDGFLYYSLGDGGAAGDPLGSGQDKNSFLGKILRIDVDSGNPYGIPPTNPFANGGGLPEVYAYGMRNAWRLSFDRETGDLWAGDVGQDLWEEIDRVALGGNYGWRVMEGNHCYNSATCNSAGAIPPLVEHPHTLVGQPVGPNDANSITGGYVYRGKAIPSLVGTYVYGDFVTGNIWGLYPSKDGKFEPRFLMNVSSGIASFGEDLEGELYIVGFAGLIHKMVPNGSPAPDTFPKTLSATGCFESGDPRRPGPALIPYEPISPLWSDNARKTRYFAIPDGKKISLKDDGDFDFPAGSVMVKHFEIDGKFVETRLFMRHDDGRWAGYSYEWNETQTDAVLLSGGKVKSVGAQSWTYPSRGECLSCHTSAAGDSLGLELSQMNHDLVYSSSGRRANQLRTLSHIGLFDVPIPMLAKYLVDPKGPSGTPEEKARAYLHANCSNCHRPQGTGLGGMNLLYSVPLSASKLCDANERGDVGISLGAKIVSPGRPTESVLMTRIGAVDARRMPPIGTSIVDVAGSKVINDWILEMKSCP